MLLACAFLLSSGVRCLPNAGHIDRRRLVTRHNLHPSTWSTRSPLQVGNGEFAFGMDRTGLQTFVPFNTLSQWGWASTPLPHGVKTADYQRQVCDTHGRPIRYPLPDPAHPEISDWLAGNPHRINLGRIGLYILKADGSAAIPDDLKQLDQSLDLWQGIATSRFLLEGTPVRVTTSCHPSSDTVAVRIDSALIGTNRLGIFISSPTDDGRQFADYVGDWQHPALLTLRRGDDSKSASLDRNFNGTRTTMSLRWQGSASLRPEGAGSGALRVVDARYGADNRWANVTPQIRKRVENNRLTGRAGAALGVDPAYGVVKTLRLTYSYGNAAHLVELREDQEMAIEPGADANRWILMPAKGSGSLNLSCNFAPTSRAKDAVAAQKVFNASVDHWSHFWRSGGAVDLSGSRDPRWFELERRIVLSQYLLAINETGSLPPQESGLVNNGWFGRFHMEMLWWHEAHWALWNRWDEFNHCLDAYRELFPLAQKTAALEGYRGVRWPKCPGPNAWEWPHEIHSFLIWQQPHPLYFAELDYQAHPTTATLRRWWPLVKATADFMASYAYRNRTTGRYDLGPPVHLASENTEPRMTQNPTFELAYWRFGLRIAGEWRKHMHLQPDPDWRRVEAALAPLPVQDGLYVLHEGVKDMWTRFNFEHPALLGALGMLPGDGVDRKVMRKTLDQVIAKWNFGRAWGWDYPLMAMTAARLGEPDRAIDFLANSRSQFQFDENGFATGGPFPYMPANGGLLYAVAMMAAGWDDSPKTNAPGFPAKGWKVRWENLSPSRLR